MNALEQLVCYYGWLRQFGYNDSHSGNASVREGDTVWMTPAGACADMLKPEDIIQCRLPDTVGRNASGDAALHLAVYRASPRTCALLHSHGPYAVAMTLNGDDFEPFDFEGRQYFPRVPVVTIPYETYFDEAPAKMAAMLAEYRIGIVRGHGVYAAAESLELAYKWTCSLELSAKTAFLACQAGTAQG
jgi:L-fuculose-phosphate aldolase